MTARRGEGRLDEPPEPDTGLHCCAVCAEPCQDLVCEDCRAGLSGEMADEDS